MFDSLSDRLSGVFDRLRGRGALNEADVRAAMREVRIALLAADVALTVVREFVDKATEQAVGQQVLRSSRRASRWSRCVHDGAGRDARRRRVRARHRGHAPRRRDDGRPPGLGQDDDDRQAGQAPQGQERQEGDDGVADVNRPAAQEQLAVLGQQTSVATLPVVAGQSPSRSPGERCNRPSCRALRRADARHRRAPPTSTRR